MDLSSEEIVLARGWLQAAGVPAIVAAVEGVYAATAQEVAARGPACWASGRCCNFAKTGHLLYVTGLEAAYTVARVGEQPAGGLTPGAVEAARAAGGCPFQVGNLCGAHPVRPLGCRVYFCDRAAQDWQQDLYERQMLGIRRIHDEHGVEYRYDEWRRLLSVLARVG